jgi:Uma2 family endonuclease
MNAVFPLKHDPARWSLDYSRAFYESRPHGERWQLVDGIPYMMTPPTRDHQIVATNLIMLLNELLRQHQPDIMAVGPLGITAPENDHYQPEPDVTVVDTTTDEERYIETALAVAEVLSPTNTTPLIAKKVAFYKTLPLARYVLVVEPKRYEATLHARAEGWAKQTLRGPDARLVLPDFAFDQPLSALYARTALARRRG